MPPKSRPPSFHDIEQRAKALRDTQAPSVEQAKINNVLQLIEDLAAATWWHFCGDD